jgi:UDP-glucose 4-epimerase
MKILITGGAGFIGSHLSEALFALGHEITVIDNYTSGSKHNLSLILDKIRMVNGDIQDEKLVEKLVCKSDLIFHLAAAVGVKKILEYPIESISTNIFGSKVVLNSAAKHNKRIIIASSSEIYGKNPNQPLSESDERYIGSPQRIRWSYSDSKAIEEAIASFLNVSKDLPVTTVRIFNTVGPRQIGQYGMVIPRFVSSALNNLPLKIYGDGTQSRVFCHISDTVDALIKLAQTDKSIGQVLNLGGVNEIEIKNLAHLTIQITNSNSQTLFVPYEEAYSFGFEDMKRRVPDISKIMSIIDWKPIKGIEDIIRDTVQAYKTTGLLPSGRF